MLLALFCFSYLFGQAPIEKESYQPRFFAFWGWNLGAYSKTEIHFQGEHHDFILNDVKAKDRPTKFAFDPYFHPERITLPQTNFRMGYFLNSKYSLSLGVDHMKYVMTQDQEVMISGEISQSGSSYDGTYNNEAIVLDARFLKFEHTDGLNYANFEVRRHFPIWSWHKSKRFSLDIENFTGIGVGAMVPRSDVRMFDTNRSDEYHLAGFASHAVTGLGLRFWKHLALWTEFKGGFINMPDIRTSTNPLDRASQHFWFGEFDVMIGGMFSFADFKRKK